METLPISALGIFGLHNLPMQTYPDSDLIENKLSEHFKPWAYRVGRTCAPKGSNRLFTHVYVAKENMDFVRQLLKDFSAIIACKDFGRSDFFYRTETNLSK